MQYKPLMSEFAIQFFLLHQKNYTIHSLIAGTIYLTAERQTTTVLRKPG
jgi:hypothetical protein